MHDYIVVEISPLLCSRPFMLRCATSAQLPSSDMLFSFDRAIDHHALDAPELLFEGTFRVTVSLFSAQVLARLAR